MKVLNKLDAPFQKVGNFDSPIHKFDINEEEQWRRVSNRYKLIECRQR